ncbi:hypothetical protein Tco_0600711 [Tanacetum coccineum]
MFLSCYNCVLGNELLELITQVAKEGSEVAKRAFVRLRKESYIAGIWEGHELLEFIQKVDTITIYSAGIWHNASVEIVSNGRDCGFGVVVFGNSHIGCAIDAYDLLKLKEVTNLTVAALASLVNWFHSKFHVKSSNIGRSINSAFVAALETQIGTLEEVLCCDKHDNYCNYTTNVVFKGVHQL